MVGESVGDASAGLWRPVRVRGAPQRHIIGSKVAANRAVAGRDQAALDSVEVQLIKNDATTDGKVLQQQAPLVVAHLGQYRRDVDLDRVTLLDPMVTSVRLRLQLHEQRRFRPTRQFGIDPLQRGDGHPLLSSAGHVTDQQPTLLDAQHGHQDSPIPAQRPDNPAVGLGSSHHPALRR